MSANASLFGSASVGQPTGQSITVETDPKAAYLTDNIFTLPTLKSISFPGKRSGHRNILRESLSRLYCRPQPRWPKISAAFYR